MIPYLIYCNFCTSSVVDDRGTKKYYLEKCGKIFCESCVSSKTCSKCGPDSSKRLLDRNISAEVGCLFEDPSKKIKGISSSIEYQFKRFINQIQMMKAEKTHIQQKMRNLTEFSKGLQKKNRELVQDANKKEQIINELRAQIKSLREQPTYRASPTLDEDDRNSFQLNLTNGNSINMNLSFGSGNRTRLSDNSNKVSLVKQQQFRYPSFESARIRSSTPLPNSNVNTSRIFSTTGSNLAPSIISRRSRVTRLEHEEHHYRN